VVLLRLQASDGEEQGDIRFGAHIASGGAGTVTGWTIWVTTGPRRPWLARASTNPANSSVAELLIAATRVACLTR
jgi:hypothetical protein